MTLKKIILFSYAFIFGTLIGFLLSSNVVPRLALPWTVVAFVLVVISLVLILYPVNYKKNTVLSVIIIVIGLSAGAANYYRVTVLDKNNITNYLDTNRDDLTTVRGTIIRDTDVRDLFTNIIVRPEEIKPDPDQPGSEFVKLSGNTGYLQAKVYPSIGKYYETISYGDYIELNVNIAEPLKMSNPTGFDWAQYLRARGVYAVTTPIRMVNEIKHVGTGKANSLVRYAVQLRKRIMTTILNTIPSVEASFLGAVTVGLRGGLSKKIRSDFQATGVAHVLALSGLHVGFIATLIIVFVGLFWRVVYGNKILIIAEFTFIAAALFIFVLLTGASPATQRAALMFIIGLSLYKFFPNALERGNKLYASTKVTIVISAFIVLLLNPLWLPESSFVLSYMAILSLVYITPPLYRLLVLESKPILRGILVFPTFFLLVSFSAISLIPALFNVDFTKLVLNLPKVNVQLSTLLPVWWMTSVMLFIAGLLVYWSYYFFTKTELVDNIMYPKSTTGIFFKGLLYFTIMQLAIQLGMMWPLSAVYFSRFPIAGFYANFLAIPLIGVIVQLGWIAGLADLFFSVIGLPQVGHSIALFVSTINLPLTQWFLNIAKTWGEYIPYPFVSVFSTKDMIAWYSLIAVLINYRPITTFIKTVHTKYFVGRTIQQKVVIFIPGIVLILLMFSAKSIKKNDNIKITFFDAGYGNSSLIIMPSKKVVLIDTGQRGYGTNWDFAETVLLPACARYGINRIDLVCITSLRPGNMGGAVYLTDNFTVKKIVLPRIFKTRIKYNEFIKEVNDSKYIFNPYNPEIATVYRLYYDLNNILLQNKDINIIDYTMVNNNVVYQEKYNSKEIGLEILKHPNVTGTEDDMGNNSAVLKLSYGKTSVLFGSNISAETEKWLVTNLKQKLKSRCLVIPNHGSPYSSTQEFIKAVSPTIAVCQYGYLSQRRRVYEPYVFSSDIDMVIKNYDTAGAKVYRTDVSGAVTLTFNGDTEISERNIRVMK